MPNPFELIRPSALNFTSDIESNIEHLKEQVPLIGLLKSLFEEIDMMADIFYFSYNAIRQSEHSIRVYEGQMLFYESVNQICLDIKILSEGFSAILSSTGESYNRFENFKHNLEYIKRNLHRMNADHLLTLLRQDLNLSNTEDDKKVEQVFEILVLTIKSLSVQLEIFYNTIDVLIEDYNRVEAGNTTLNDGSNHDSDSFELKFNVYTRCIDAILEKYVTISMVASQKIGAYIGAKHLTTEQASEQLAQLEQGMKNKFADRHQNK